MSGLGSWGLDFIRWYRDRYGREPERGNQHAEESHAAFHAGFDSAIEFVKEEGLVND